MRKRTKARLGMVAAAGWAVVTSVGIATLMVGHWVTLPRPATTSPKLAASLTALKPAGSHPRMHVVHFLYGACGCSRRVVEHLLHDPRPTGVHETLVLVGDAPEWAHAARARGFRVLPVSREALVERFGVSGLPLFAVVDEHDTVLHLGGYTARKQGLAMRDVATVASLREGRAAVELPLFGCATSAELQRALDPLGIKYGWNKNGS